MLLGQSCSRELLQVGCVADIEHPESKQHDRYEEETAHIRSRAFDPSVAIPPTGQSFD